MSIATKRGDSGQTGLTGGDEELRTLTKDLQRELFKVGSAISTPLENKKPAPEIPLGDWAIPGEDPCSAAFDVSRTICRRAERLVVGLIESGLESWKQRREPWQVNVLRRRRSSPRSPMRTTRGVRWISSMANASGLPANWVRNRAPPTFCLSSSTGPLHRSRLASSNRRS